MSITIHKTVHYSLLGICLFSFVTMVWAADDIDPQLSYLNSLQGLFCSLFIIYSFIVHLKTNRDVRVGLITKYRLLSEQKTFLKISNVILTTLLALLLYKIVFFRSVEIVSTENVDIYGTQPDQHIDDALMHLEKEKVAHIRVRVGTQYILYKRTIDRSDFRLITPFYVGFFWQKEPPERIIVSDFAKYETFN